MVTQVGRESAALIERLFSSPDRFDFFQAVRLIESWAQRCSEPDGPSWPIGFEHAPASEAVRFRSDPSLAFPEGEIRDVRRPLETPEDDIGGNAPASMSVTFMGLTGPTGVLPDHYTRLVMDRIRAGDPTLHDFLDMFHHRLVSLFFRAWEKHHVAVSFQRARSFDAEQDCFSGCLSSLIGFGTKNLQERLELPPESLLRYVGHFSDSARTAAGLEQLLTHFYGMPASVELFQGSWLYLDDEDRTRLGGVGFGAATHCELGVDFVLGRRVRDVQSKFRVVIGPLTFGEFHRLLPGGVNCRSLFQLIRLYVGSELDFDVQPVLRAEEIPGFRLQSDEKTGVRLGWNSWTHSESPAADADDVVFSLDAIEPLRYSSPPDAPQ